MMEKEAFLMKPKHQCCLSRHREWAYGARSWKEGRLLCQSVFVTIDKWTLPLKKDGKKTFSCETKASMLFIPMQRMSLWCPIMNKKPIAMWIGGCLNWQMNFNSKKGWKDKLFLWIQGINVIYPNEENEFMVPNHKNKGDYYVNLWLSLLTNELWH